MNYNENRILFISIYQISLIEIKCTITGRKHCHLSSIQRLISRIAPFEPTCSRSKEKCLGVIIGLTPCGLVFTSASKIVIFDPGYDDQLFHVTSRRRTCTNISRWNYRSMVYGKWRSYNLFPVARNYDVRTHTARATNFYPLSGTISDYANYPSARETRTIRSSSYR